MAGASVGSPGRASPLSSRQNSVFIITPAGPETSVNRASRTFRDGTVVHGSGRCLSCVRAYETRCTATIYWCQAPSSWVALSLNSGRSPSARVRSDARMTASLLADVRWAHTDRSRSARI